MYNDIWMRAKFNSKMVGMAALFVFVIEHGQPFSLSLSL